MNEQTPKPESTVVQEQSVAELVRNQRDLYRSLHRLAERQRRLIAADDPSALLSLLSQRQSLTRSLVELGQRLAPYREDWPATSESLDPSHRREVQDMLDEARDLLGQIIAADEEDARLLTARKAKAAADLTTFRSGRQAVCAYASAARGGADRPNRFDRINERS